MKILQVLLFIVSIILPRVLQIQAGAFNPEKRPCTFSGQQGTCQRKTNCPMAIDYLNKTGTTFGLKNCGFIGLDELVCCITSREPSTDVPRSTSSKNSKEFCKEISFNIGGRNAILYAESGEYPHMAALGYPRNDNSKDIDFKCGATIISHKFLLTVAHCIRHEIKPKIARLGITNLTESNPQDVDIKNTIIYSEYHSDKLHNDIGLVELARSLVFNKHVRPACLYFKDSIPSSIIATGWGTTSGSDILQTSNRLKKAILNPESNSKCNEYYSGKSVGSKDIIDTQFCAKRNAGSSCSGDSGGPVQIKEGDIYHVVGITSFGTRQCEQNISVVYTKVSKYVKWIDSIVYVA